LSRDLLDPSRTALLIFDMLEGYRARIEETGALGPAISLLSVCRERGIPIFFARADHRDDGTDLNRSLTDTDSSFRPWGPDDEQPRLPTLPRSRRRILAELAPEPEDYDVPKHRWSAFYQTSLELGLRTRGIDTLLLIGGSTHVGIASTAFAARDMDFNVVIVSDGCFGFEEQKRFFVERVFPRMARVRTSDQVAEMLAAREAP
jgi:nicotinamidase-related amidase